MCTVYLCEYEKKNEKKLMIIKSGIFLLQYSMFGNA